MKSPANITLREIIERKIFYCRNNDNKDLILTNAGYVRGYNQMLEDLDFSEEEFIAKYCGIVKEMKDLFEAFQSGKLQVENVDELSGYNNAIVDVLALLDEKYFYDEG